MLNPMPHSIFRLDVRQLFFQGFNECRSVLFSLQLPTLKFPGFLLQLTGSYLDSTMEPIQPLFSGPPLPKRNLPENLGRDVSHEGSPRVNCQLWQLTFWWIPSLPSFSDLRAELLLLLRRSLTWSREVISGHTMTNAQHHAIASE